MLPGREGVKQFFREWRTGFRDGHVNIDLEIAEGDLVTCYETWSGTHSGTFLGIPASGKQVSFAAVDIIRVADGQFVEHWGITDVMGFMEQIGASPAPGQPG